MPPLRQAAISPSTPQPLAVRTYRPLTRPQSTKRNMPLGHSQHPSARPSAAFDSLNALHQTCPALALAGQNRNGYSSHQALCHSSEVTRRPISVPYSPFTPPFLPSHSPLRPVLLFSPLFSSLSPHSHSLQTSSPLRSITFLLSSSHTIASIILQRCFGHEYITTRIDTTLALRNPVDATLLRLFFSTS